MTNALPMQFEFLSKIFTNWVIIVVDHILFSTLITSIYMWKFAEIIKSCYDNFPDGARFICIHLNKIIS